MRILVISYYYSPSFYPRAQRWSAICEHWAGQGVDVDVVCCREAPDSRPVGIENGVTVNRVADPASRLSQGLNAATPAGVECATVSKGRLNALSKSLFRHLVRLLRWPDYAGLWIVPAYRAARKLLRTHKYDGVISVALPFSGHLVGLLLHRGRTRAAWVCDYGDPYSFQPDNAPYNYRLYGWVSRYIERRVVRASKRVAVTTVETAVEFVSRLGVDEKWVKTIPPLFKPIQALQFRPEARAVASGGIRLIFAGTLYRKIRNPGFALAVIAKLRERSAGRKIRMDIYGGVGECSREFEAYLGAANDWLFVHGPINHRALVEEYARADILVNIGNSTPYQLPSKVLEYVATGLPILNFASIETDSVAAFLRSHSETLTVFATSGVTEQVVGDCLAFVERATPVDRETVRNCLNLHAPEVIAGDYMKLLFEEAGR